MATKEDSTTKAAKATPVKTADLAATPKDAEEESRVSDCVVNDGRGMHVGNAVNGKVCSYHAMHYDSHGNPR